MTLLYPQVLLADLVHNETPEDRELVQIQLEELEAECSEEGFHAHEPGEDGVKRDISYLDGELCERYREIPLKTTPYSQFEMRPGVKEGVVVVGGETEVLVPVYLPLLVADTKKEHGLLLTIFLFCIRLAPFGLFVHVSF